MIGLGKMGGNMATRLIQKGISVVGFDRSAEVVKTLEEKAKMMSDHSYDGITELDNFMPPWLQWVFIGSIGFAVIYFVDYTVLGTGLTGEEEYQEELRLEAVAAEGRKASMHRLKC